jgi:hypothetical protein
MRPLRKTHSVGQIETEQALRVVPLPPMLSTGELTFLRSRSADSPSSAYSRDISGIRYHPLPAIPMKKSRRNTTRVRDPVSLSSTAL